MKREKIFKKILAVAGIAAMLFGVMPTGQAQARLFGTYNFPFTPPFVGCGRSSEDMRTASGKSPYVYPAAKATKTTYCLIVKTSPLIISTNFVKLETKEKKTFTYKSQYVGDKKTRFRLYGFPTDTKFSGYIVTGKFDA